MSWDVIFKSADKTMGPKDQVRELFLAACERITGDEVPRRGPTEVAVDPSFDYEVYFVGHKRAIESLCLSMQINEGDPHNDPKHPVWSFLRQVREITAWQVVDTHKGSAVD